MDQRIWISYDLGINGDYESLYTWLDNHGAKECGDSIATLTYQYRQNILNDLTRDLKKHINLVKKNRIYVIFKDPTKGWKGKFIIGGRKRAPWEGYSTTEYEEDDDYEG